MPHHQPLAGIIRAGDLGQIALVEQRELQGSVRSGERLDGRGAQRGDPVEPGRDQILAQPCLGDHAAIPDQDYAAEAEAMLELVDLAFEGAGIGGIAGKHLDRDRAAFLIAQHAKDDLPFVVAVVAAVAVLGQWAAAAFQIG